MRAVPWPPHRRSTRPLLSNAAALFPVDAPIPFEKCWRMLREKIIAVVIPAFNEADKIAATIRSVPVFVDYVIVVDDGSRDGTASVARRGAGHRVEVIVHPEN